MVCYERAVKWTRMKQVTIMKPQKMTLTNLVQKWCLVCCSCCLGRDFAGNSYLQQSLNRSTYSLCVVDVTSINIDNHHHHSHNQQYPRYSEMTRSTATRMKIVLVLVGIVALAPTIAKNTH
uniref:Uncharacterized protein n=1 Tax=Lygus hesperus TaxID=30085 RepID=A0A146KJR6_LYGHE